MTKFCIFLTPPVPFQLSRPNAAKYRNSKKNWFTTEGCSPLRCQFRRTLDYKPLRSRRRFTIFFRRTLCQGRTVRACVHSVGMLCGYMPNSSYVCTTSLGRQRTTSDYYVCTTSLGRQRTTSDHYACTTSLGRQTEMPPVR